VSIEGKSMVTRMVWLATLSSKYVFSKKEQVIQVWNDMRVYRLFEFLGEKLSM